MKKYYESTYLQLFEAIDYLEELNINNSDNALWWCLHRIVWHKGIDRVRWLLENKDLVKRISNQRNLPDDKELNEFWESVNYLKSLDR